VTTDPPCHTPVFGYLHLPQVSSAATAAYMAISLAASTAASTVVNVPTHRTNSSRALTGFTNGCMTPQALNMLSTCARNALDMHSFVREIAKFYQGASPLDPLPGVAPRPPPLDPQPRARSCGPWLAPAPWGAGASRCARCGIVPWHSAHVTDHSLIPY